MKEIRNNISIPVSVKLSSDYTNILNFIIKLDQTGVDAFVLFNSFFQPDIDIKSEKHIKSFYLSNEGDFKKSLRYAGLLFENIKADICSSHGIFTGADVIKLILSGSSCVQVVSTLYKNGLTQITNIKKELADWMDIKNYKSIDEFKGKLSKNKLSSNPFVYKEPNMSICLLIQRRYLEVPYKVYIYFPGNILIRIVLMLQLINLFSNSQNSLIQIIINGKFIIYRF